MSITSVLYLKDEVSIATAGAADSVVMFWDTRNLTAPVTMQLFQPVVSPSAGAIAGWMATANPSMPHTAVAAGPPGLVQPPVAAAFLKHPRTPPLEYSQGNNFRIGCEELSVEEVVVFGCKKNVCHCYPKCPQPELTVGLTAHTDPRVLTVLVQNEVGGLFLVKCGEDWADIEAVPGAIIINIGDR